MSKTRFRMILLLLAASWFLTCGGSSCKDSSDDGPEYVPGEVWVRFVPGTTQSEVEALAGDLGLTVQDIAFDLEAPSDVRRAVFVVPVGEELDWIPVIEESPIVRYATLNSIATGGPDPIGCSAGM